VADLSHSGKACVVSAQNIQNRISALGATYKRKDDAILNTAGQFSYDWKETNSGKNSSNRRMWFIRRDPNLVKLAENHEQTQKAENVIIAQNSVRKLNTHPEPTHPPIYSVAANRAAINTKAIGRNNIRQNKYENHPAVFYGKPVFSHNPILFQPIPTLTTKIRLFYNYYEDKNPERQKEIDYCLQKNIDNPLLDIIILESEKTQHTIFISRR
jgi:hypothetical protein